MDIALSPPPTSLPRPARLAVLAGFAAMYLPTYWWAATTIWQTEDHAHGAIILIVAAWLFWRRRQAILQAAGRPAPMAGWSCFALGALLYIVGRSQDVTIFEMGSQIPVLAGAILLLAGRRALKAAWFPLFYLVFMIPLPGVFVDAVTAPLKQWISIIAENALYAAGYPIARSGVVISIGQYQLLVADACSGLHSMYSLSALGALYLYLAHRAGFAHNLLMAASILPIAFTANVVRVMFLVLLTYHFGDDAGQGFLHGTAGLVLIVAALLFLFLLDRLLAGLPLGKRHA
ncbi:MAG TPA: exosortase B [Rhodocyclaceae bacterium]|nr:exosortase B [Rhodocyclaceae bacterium]